MQYVKDSFTFVDLFSGIGGFHQALKTYGGICVAASEINQSAKEVYVNNFPDTPMFDDINLCWDKLPTFDVLAGGFPCQPFSKAGNQKGFEDETSGNLFFVIVKILKMHPECKFVLLENVKNLADKTENWEIITSELKKLNFYITEEPLILSPNQFNIPQLRERVYILGIRKDIRDDKKLKNGFIHMDELGDFNSLPKTRQGIPTISADSILEKTYPSQCLLSNDEISILDAWLEFKKITKFDKISVPVWLDYFGYKQSDFDFSSKKYHHLVKDKNGKQIKTTALISEMPKWKQHFIYKNREFYIKHKLNIDLWIEKYNMLDQKQVYKKFEWNCGNNKKIKDFKKTIIQFRQSGIRVKINNFFPTLVAINNTPIIFDKKNKILRKISPREAANLQGFKIDYKMPNNYSTIYKQLGNAVNVKIVEKVFEKLSGFALDNWRQR